METSLESLGSIIEIAEYFNNYVLYNDEGLRKRLDFLLGKSLFHLFDLLTGILPPHIIFLVEDAMDMFDSELKLN